MTLDFSNEVKLFMIFDILGDTERTGPLLWHINRKRLEDIKNHTLDLIIISRILRNYLPSYIDFDKLTEYIICHDLPEAITGDITIFEGVSKEEIARTTNIAVKFLQENFGDIINFEHNINAFENGRDIEAKIARMIDKIHSATTFIKYQSEANVDLNNHSVMPTLRNHPFVVEKVSEGKDLADIFYEFHLRSVDISDEECAKYGISRTDGDKIVEVLKEFAAEMYKQKCNKTLFDIYNKFPLDAMKYNRNKN